ncbi:MAG TPA: serine/threonine-protein kinase [Candidatus Thermoplasmatota archaeon]|nr:serine/threonine-protein kinase [Candidatus Thermoplasmatota archaeon]
MAPPPDTVLAFASGFPLLLLGVLLLVGKPRGRSKLFFGAFSLLWGLQVVLANLGRVLQDANVHHVALLASYACLVPASLFLVHFASCLRPEGSSPAARWIPVAVSGLLGAAAAGVLLWRPQLVVASVLEVEDVLVTSFGPAWLPLIQAPFFGAFFYAIVVLARDYRRATPGTPRHRVRGVLLAFVLFTSYITARQVASFLLAGGIVEALAYSSGGVRFTDRPQALAQGLFFLAGAAVLAALAVRLALRPPPPEGVDAPLLLAFTIPAATAVAEAFFLQDGVPFETLGFWRLLTVGVLAYTLTRHHLFDLDVDVGRFVGPGLAGVLLVLGIPLALALTSGGDSFGAILPAMAIEAVAIAATLFFSDNIREALFPAAPEAPEGGRDRRLEIYRTALEEELSRGSAPDSPELREMRLRLGVPEREHQLMVWFLGGDRARTVAPAARLEEGSLVLSRYRLVRLLGRGSTGRTFLAYDQVLRAEVAVKVVETTTLGGEAAKGLLREARLAAALLHPNILRVLDVGETPGAALLVTEYAEQGNLADVLKRRGPLPLPEAARMLHEILLALGAMHARGVVHRNLKPKNLLVEEDGTVKIGDFGAAWAATAEPLPGEGEGAVSASFSVLYMSPEAVEGKTATARSDLYVAAVLFHEALTGRSYLPITGKDDAGLRHLVRTAPPQLHLPPEARMLEPFLLRALQKRPEDRFPTATEMAAALTSHLPSLGASRGAGKAEASAPKP